MEIYSVIAAFILFALIVTLRNARIRRNTTERVAEKLEKEGYNLTVRIDETHQRYSLLADMEQRAFLIVEPQAERHRVYAFQQLLGYDVRDGGVTVKTGGDPGFTDDTPLSGRAAIDDRPSQNAKYCRSLLLRLRLEGSPLPVTVLPLIERETERASLEFLTAKQTLDSLTKLFDKMLQPEEAAAPRAESEPSEG